MHGGIYMRQQISVILAMVVLVATVASVSAHGNTSVTPWSSNKAYGQLAGWTVSWPAAPSHGSGTWVTFCYGDGTCNDSSTSGTSRSFSHRFYPCATTKYTHRVASDQPNHVQVVNPYTWVTGSGGPC